MITNTMTFHMKEAPLCLIKMLKDDSVLDFTDMSDIKKTFK